MLLIGGVPVADIAHTMNSLFKQDLARAQEIPGPTVGPVDFRGIYI